LIPEEIATVRYHTSYFEEQFEKAGFNAVQLAHAVVALPHLPDFVT